MSEYAKPQPHNDAGDTLGTLHNKPEERDAIHLAVIQVSCAAHVQPGTHLRYLGNNKVERCDTNEGHGIADPFIAGDIFAGEKFWLVLYPRQIRSLRHVWEHPAFEPSTQPAATETDPEKVHKMLLLIDDPRAKAVQTIRDVSKSLGVNYDQLIEAADGYLESGEYWCEGDRFDGESIPDNFWTAYEVVTGKSVPDEDKGSFLSCSC